MRTVAVCAVAVVAKAPWDIRALTEAFLRRGFLTNADVTAGRINRWTSLPVSVAANDLRRVATRVAGVIGMTRNLNSFPSTCLCV